MTIKKNIVQENEFLSMFPKLNPNPLLGLNLKGEVIFYNDACRKVLKCIRRKNDCNIFLPKDIKKILRDSNKKGETKSIYKEVKIKNRIFSENIKINTKFAAIYITEITTQRKVETALTESEKRYRTVVENQADLICRAKPDGTITFVNNAYCKYYGKKKEDLIGKKYFNHLLPKDQEIEKKYLKTFDKFNKIQEIDHEAKNSKGITRWQHWVDRAIFDKAGKIQEFQFVGKDVTCQKATEKIIQDKEKELQKLNRTLRALSDSSRLMMYSKDENIYLNDICSAIVKDCGYVMAWIGYAVDDNKKTVRPVAQAGFENGYLNCAKISWADNKRGRGPTGTAIRTNSIRICKNILTDPALKPWRKNAIRRGYESSIVLPLSNKKEVFGALTIYSKQPNPFIEKEIHLLSQLARDLSYGIINIRLKEKRAKDEKALRESENKFRQLYSSMSSGFAVHDIVSKNGKPVDYIITSVNPSFEKIIGLKREKIIGKRATEIYKLSSAPYLDIYAKVALTRVPMSFEDYFAPMKKFLYISVFSPAVGQFATIFRDITEEKRNLELLQRSEEHFRAISENVPDIIMRFDQNLKVIYANSAALKRIGQNREKIIGKTAIEYGTEAKAASIWEKAVRDAMHSGKIKRIEHQSVRRGETMIFDVYIIPEFDSNKCVSSVVTFARDITEHKKEDESKNNFIATMSHELRNPLASILTNIELINLLRKDNKIKNDTTVVESLGIIERQTKNMSKLLDDLLDIARIERGTVNLKKEKIDLSSLVKNVIDATSALIKKQDHKLSVVLPDEHIYLNADPLRFEQILVNLLNNAAKYTPYGGSINLEAKRIENEIEIRIKDNGIGIEEHEQRNIFELFRHSAKPFVDTKGDFGIGLKITKDLVGLHGGTIKINSEGRGKGSEFIVRLPILPQTVMKQPVVEIKKEENKNSTKILVIDDNIDITKSISGILKYFGHEVATANDGKSGIKVAKIFKPQIIILDIGMPGMNGYEVARELRKNKNVDSSIKLIALTGFGQDEDKALAQKAKFDFHLTKPVLMEDLNKIINECLKRD